MYLGGLREWWKVALHEDNLFTTQSHLYNNDRLWGSYSKIGNVCADTLNINPFETFRTLVYKTASPEASNIG